LELTEILAFRDHRPSGAAKVVMPTVMGCPVCSGCRGLIVDGRTIIDPELAYKASLVLGGYILRINEERAAGGGFRGLDGHEAWPDDWQYVPDSKPCTCDISMQKGPDCHPTPHAKEYNREESISL
jgi:hypothetical protein